jgi:rSAM/selenodomain-associated transferase 1
MSTLGVICKAPVPGRVKTRLCPPCAPEEAAALATAALHDTFAAVLATPCERRVAIVDGEAGSWLPPGIDVVAQRQGGLGDRLAGAFDDVGAPMLVIGMDTPQVTPGLLGQGLRAVAARGSALGPAADGGYWAIGLARPDRHVFLGVPMSTAETGAAQLRRMRARGLTPELLPALTDVDDIASARLAARVAPAGRFAGVLRELETAALR